MVGDRFNGQIPNQAGIGGSQAPYILWNFPQAQTIRVTGGASIEGTIYAPHAVLTWAATQNIEGNVIARTFKHGAPNRGPGSASRDPRLPVRHHALVRGCAEATDRDAHSRQEGDQRRQRLGRAVGLDAER